MKKISEWSALFLLSTLILAGCGGSGSSSSEKSAVVTRVEITPASVLMTATDQTVPLTAIVYDQNGDEMPVTVTWSSSHEDVVQVDANDIAAAQGNIGSALITAEAEGVTSEPVLALVSETVPGAVLVNDDQIVGNIVFLDSDTYPTVGSQYQITLGTSSPPEVDDILVGTGDLPIGGQVISVVPSGNDYVVVLELVPVDAMFTQLVINEQLDLAMIEPIIPDEIAASYDVTPTDGGMLLFDLKSDISASLLPDEVQLGPFTCKSETSGIIPDIVLSNPVTSMSISRNLSLDLAYDSALGGFQKASIIGNLGAEFKANPALAVALTSKVTCKAELGVIPLPIPTGPLTWVLGFYVPIGLGFEVGGQMELAQVSLDIDVKAHYSAEFGIACYYGTPCTSIHDLTNDNSKFETKISAPTNNLQYDFRLKPEIYGFGYANLNIGVARRSIAGRIVSIISDAAFLEAELLEAKGGLKQSGDFALIQPQIEESAYSSEYKLTLSSSIGAGSTINDFLDYLSLTGSVFEYQFPDYDLAHSPRASYVEADTNEYDVGDTVTFEVKLKAEDINYSILGYNVENVQIYQKKPAAGGGYNYIHLFDMPATDGQTHFEHDWLFSEAGEIADNFYAFVETTYMPTVGELGLLELGPVDAISLGEIYFITSEGLFSVNDDNTELQRILPGPVTSDGYNITFSPDGSKLAFVNADRKYTILDLNDWSIHILNIPVTQRLEWSADSNRILILVFDNGATFRSYDINGTLLSSWPVDPADSRYFSLSPDNKVLYPWRVDSPLSQPDEIKSLNLTTGSDVFFTNDRSHTFSQPVWSPDGSKAIMLCHPSDYSSMGWNICNPAGEVLRTGGNLFHQWSPDGQKILYLTGEVLSPYPEYSYAHDICTMTASGGAETCLRTVDDSNMAFSYKHHWSPDGSKIVLSTYLLGAVVLDANSKTILSVIDAPGYPIWIGYRP